MGVGISIIVGVLAGIVPAWTAARLSPVDAMRSK
jgi:ABC-type antimicrobial peptide transport system permease subunit